MKSLLTENQKPSLLWVINSRIGVSGNIGFRIAKIIESAASSTYSQVFCRGSWGSFPVKVHTMGLLGHVPRLLNAIRIYFYKKFPHRLLDILWFELFILLSAVTHKIPKTKRGVVHLVEYSPFIISLLKKYGYQVILDVPIAPSRYCRKTVQQNSKYQNCFSYTDQMMKQEESAFQLSHHIIVPSEFVKTELMDLALPAEKISIVPFGAHVDSWNKTAYKEQTSGLDFVFAGNINFRKGVQFLLEAWDHPDFIQDRLHLCGRMFPEIQKLLHRYRFKNVVTPGFIKTEDYFKFCDVYVFPSTMEGSSKSVYEAMNRCLPTITTYESGSIVRDGVDGYIVPKGDPTALRAAMKRFKSEPQLIQEMGNNAKNYIKSFTWEAYASNVTDIYAKVAASNNSPD